MNPEWGGGEGGKWVWVTLFLSAVLSPILIVFTYLPVLSRLFNVQVAVITLPSSKEVCTISADFQKLLHVRAA